MRRWVWFLLMMVMGVHGGGALRAQSPRPLKLSDAHTLALRNHPQIHAAELRASAAGYVPREVRSSYFPHLVGNLTGAGAEANSRIAAGGLNNPVIFSRYAHGFTVNQLITDFGRTANLVQSTALQARAEEEAVNTSRAQVLLQVDQAYYAALRAQAVLKVAEQTVAARQLVADQVTALANSKLKSGLDVNFANVNLAESKLLLLKAQNDVKATFADLSAALGEREDGGFELTNEPLPPAPPDNLAALIREGIRNRPELASLQLAHRAALQLVEAEKRLRFPTISAVGSAGFVPFHDSRLHGRYAASGLNISIPLFNGPLFSARQAEAGLRAQAVSQTQRDLENRVARDIKVAWLNARTGFQRLSLTAQLLDHATQALDLAEARYNLGVSSIVELSQAQLSKTSAEITYASAQYEYQIQRAVLDYQTGALR